MSTNHRELRSSTTSTRRSRLSGPATLVMMAVALGLLAVTVVAVRGSNHPVSRAVQAQQIAAGLRCPVCQDLSAADSPAPLARQMRQEIAERLAAGDSAEAIQDRFVAAYGETVLLTPPRSGPGRLAYALPLLVLVAGLAVGATTLWAWRHRPTEQSATAATLSAADRHRVDAALDRWLKEESR